MLGHADHMQALFAFNFRVAIGKHIKLAAAGADFLHIALEFFQQGIVRRHGHHRHLGRDQRQGAMLELAGRIGFGVDIADFLQLQRAFQRDRVMQATAEEQGVFLAGEFLAPGDHLRLQRQHRLHRQRQMAQGLQMPSLLLFIEMSAGLRQGQGQHEQPDQLGGEGLGRGNADLGAGAGDVSQLAFAHHRAGGHIADRQGVLHALRARMLERGQRVGGFAALADRDDQGARIRHAVAIAVFTGDLDAGRYPGNRFKPVFGRRA